MTRKKLDDIAKKQRIVHVVLSTFEMTIRDSDILQTIQWSYLIVDEAHRLKNSNAKLFQAMNPFSTRNRLLLTGTPVQNNLIELWSLLNFIVPSVFDSALSFESWFSLPLSSEHEQTLQKSESSVLSDEERIDVIDTLHRV